LQLQRTPSKTPRSASEGGNKFAFGGLSLSASKRRTPRPNLLHAHFGFDDHGAGQAPFDSPFTATINQLLSEANEFTSGSPAHGLNLDLSSLPNLDSDDVMHHLTSANSGVLDFGNFLSTDMGLPSSPPLLRGPHSFLGMDGGDPAAEAEMWAKLASHDVMGEKGEVDALE
jgi:hypothetical protein